jgi:hypothetical protein
LLWRKASYSELFQKNHGFADRTKRSSIVVR